MKLLQIPLLLLIFSCSGQTNERQKFLIELGTEKSESFELLTDSYDLFLKVNYPNKSGLGEQSRQFMIQIIEDRKPFIFDSLNAIQVLIELERTGLRKDIFVYKDESYEPTYDLEQFLPEREKSYFDLFDIDDDFEDIITLDTIELSEEQKEINFKREQELEESRKWQTYPNERGFYNYALAKAFKTDTLFLGYCDIRYSGLFPALTTEYLELPEKELELWKNQVPLMVDFYLCELLIRYGKNVIQHPSSR